VALLPDPEEAGKALEDLRTELLADPYFKGVPSMQPASGKTARYFHAKDDVPEVRREVFRLLRSMAAKVQVVIRHKTALIDFARRLLSSGERLTAHDVYDDMVARLFRNLLHKADENRITFARRGKRDRSSALAEAIDRARRNFERKWHRPSKRPTTIRSQFASRCAGFQIIDYYLWALQRMFERHEDRYFEFLRPHYRLVIDLDDKRNHEHGEYYSDHNPLELRRIEAF